MTSQEAATRIQVVLAHLWMIRNFLKHADEIQDDEAMMDVHRFIYDSIRAVEPAWQRSDWDDYLSRIRRKISKLKKTAQFFAAEYTRVSSHTNFEMASLSLRGAVEQLEEIVRQAAGSTSCDPEPAEPADSDPDRPFN